MAGHPDWNTDGDTPLELLTLPASTLDRLAQPAVRDAVRYFSPALVTIPTFDENCGNDNIPLLRASAIDVLNQLLGDEDRDDLTENLPDDEHGGDRRPVVFYS